MSGLGAIYHRDGEKVMRAELDRMTSALRLHGPDRQNSAIAGPAGLAWTRGEEFTPQDKFDQQPRAAAARWSLVFHGFLGKRLDLANKLAITDQDLLKMPDSALFMAAWQKWQTDAMSHVHGDYAFLLFDSETHTLIAARSEMSALPIFYHLRGNRLVLGSAPKAIFALRDVDRQIDETKVADSLILNYQDRDASFYKGINSLPLGCILECQGNRFEIKRHYDLNRVPDVRFANDDDYVEAAKEKLSAAVGDAMRSPNPVAASVSAGLDSSAVVVEMLSHLHSGGLGGKLDTYTAVPGPNWDRKMRSPNGIGDESGAVKALAEMYPQIDPHFVDAAGIPLDHDHDKLLLLAETPQGAIYNLHWVIDMLRSARRDGHNVVLGGQSGNSTLSFSGRALYAKLFRQGRWLKLLQELRATDRKKGLLNSAYRKAISPNLSVSFDRGVRRMTGKAALPGWEKYSAINSEFAGDMRATERMAEMGWTEAVSGFKDPRAMMDLILKAGHRDAGQSTKYAIEVLTGVQHRDPLGTRELVEFCYGLPDDQFFDAGVDRRLIKRMMAGRLPPEYFSGQRGVQAADWHARVTADLPRYKQEIERMSDDPDTARRFDMPRLRKLVNTWPEETPHNADDHPDFKLAKGGLMRAISTARWINWVEGKN